ncbi:rhomboid-5 isoform X2 [Dermatophagoides pteronyssinus]|uniref:rhomboid-5 isoform X2 n=1 Tax=Dermatophagoides pteronyssinus TaxID=6956 RepID=UPI003F66EA41
MSNIGRKKPDENFEKQLHRTLSRYGKKSKPPTIIRPCMAVKLLAIQSSTQTNGIAYENESVIAQSFRPPDIEMRNIRFADDDDDDQVHYQSSNDRLDFGLRAVGIQQSSNVRCKEDFLFDIDGNEEEEETNRKLANDDDQNFFRQFLKTEIFDLKREERPGFIWQCLGLKFANNFQKNRANGEMWPVFTYWLITMELFIMILLSTIGISPYSLSETKVSKVIWHQTNSYQPATYYQHPNIWFGPSYSTLITAGAKFTPCMRKDKNIMESFESRKLMENQYGCCLRSDLSGCVQAPISQCSNRTSYWIKWQNRSGPVCGNDPRYCLDNKSIEKTFEKNITEWPLCNQYDYQAISKSEDLYMKCNVQARPCCIGIYGKCILASKEYCQFIEGYYHPEASLCSQINCMEDVCGGSFLWPHQYYRLILSIFIHAGWIQLLVNIIIQYIFMRRLEQLLGIWRTFLIYFVSGIGGNLASAIFLPLTPEVGPNSALFGLIAFLFIESYKQRKQYGIIVFVKISAALFFLFIPGLILPFVDIYTLIFGFLYGFLMINILDPRKINCKQLRIAAAILLSILTLILILLFIFATEIIEQYRYYTNIFNCIPFLFNCSNIDIAYDEIKALN